MSKIIASVLIALVLSGIIIVANGMGTNIPVTVPVVVGVIIGMIVG